MIPIIGLQVPCKLQDLGQGAQSWKECGVAMRVRNCILTDQVGAQEVPLSQLHILSCMSTVTAFSPSVTVTASFDSLTADRTKQNPQNVPTPAKPSLKVCWTRNLGNAPAPAEPSLNLNIWKHHMYIYIGPIAHFCLPTNNSVTCWLNQCSCKRLEYINWWMSTCVCCSAYHLYSLVICIRQCWPNYFLNYI